MKVNSQSKKANDMLRSISLFGREKGIPKRLEKYLRYMILFFLSNGVSAVDYYFSEPKYGTRYKLYLNSRLENKPAIMDNIVSNCNATLFQNSLSLDFQSINQVSISAGQAGSETGAELFRAVGELANSIFESCAIKGMQTGISATSKTDVIILSSIGSLLFLAAFFYYCYTRNKNKSERNHNADSSRPAISLSRAV